MQPDTAPDPHKALKIGVVGPCAAGKSTLISSLQKFGYNPAHIAQEHSYVPDMWSRLTNPDILIYLDVSYDNTLKRRNMTWSIEEFRKQVSRFEHAREHANLYLNTDKLSTQEVLDNVIAFLQK
jgi:deoxyadenosine/deoxycytidine kinase